MKMTRGARPGLECESLEGRRCLSHVVVFPAASLPIQRVDAMAERAHTADLNAVVQGRASNVVFLGDSITQWFQSKAGARVWKRSIAPLGADDDGVFGDSTNNVLWRVENGELAGQPRVAVLLIGTNNLHGGATVAETVAGIDDDIAAIHQVSPGTQILLNGLFPRGRVTDPLRTDVEEVNAILSAQAPSLGVVYTDPGASMIQSNGSIAPDFHSDLIHPNAHGYEIWAEAIVPTIEAMLAESSSQA
jgi:lysophospholipase L1-like esterase